MTLHNDMTKEPGLLEIKSDTFADLIEIVRLQQIEVLRLEAKICAYTLFYNQVIFPDLEMGEEKIFSRNERVTNVLKLINGERPDLAGGISDPRIREEMIVEIGNLAKSLNCVDRKVTRPKFKIVEGGNA